MALPQPERGLVISYAYLWHSEHERGREQGVKNRPCVIILAVEDSDGDRVVTVAPVTHSVPSHSDQAVEIPLATKQRLGLDEARSWVLVSEVNRFAWPGPDLHRLTTDRFDYGVLPPNLFLRVQEKLKAYVLTRRLIVVPRTE